MVTSDISIQARLSLIMLFTAIFSTISIIESARGFLQSVLVAPISPGYRLWKILGGTTLALCGVDLPHSSRPSCPGIHISPERLLICLATLSSSVLA